MIAPARTLDGLADVIGAGAPHALPALRREPCRWIDQTSTDWTAYCDCSGIPRALVAVEGAARGLWSWHLRHALGGTVLRCPACSGRSALAGAVAEGGGQLDLLAEAELAAIPHATLTRLQARALDVSLAAEDMLAERAKDCAREHLRGPEREAAVLVGSSLRAKAQHEKLLTLRLILEEHGLEPDPGLRLARWDDGSGTLYMLDRGQLPLTKADPDRPATGRRDSLAAQEETPCLVSTAPLFNAR